MIEARYHDSVNVLQPLSADCPATGGPFDRPEWFALLAASGLAPCIITAGNTGAPPQAAMALTDQRGALTPLRNWYSFVWRPLVPEGPAGDALLTAMARSLRQRGYRVTLEPVPTEDGSAARIEAAFRTAGWQVRAEPCDVNHVLHVGGRSFADYWESRPGPLRTTLRRKGRKVETRILTAFDAEAWAAYEAIYQASWKPAEGDPAMLRAFAQSEGAAGRLRLALATHESVPVAAQCWTVEAGTAYIHKLAHIESHKHLSAGTTLSAALFAHVIDTDAVKLIDFGTGDQGYKADWMEDIRVRMRIDCLDAAQPRAWPFIGKRALRTLRPAAPTPAAPPAHPLASPGHHS